MANSPFPGMDPYLKGNRWPDVHQALAYQFRRQLAPKDSADPSYRVFDELNLEKLKEI